ncbi:MAG: ribonuclease HII [Bacillota bacterium]|nr:ribonuclease HII [Bacillota bacterium]
MPDLVREARWWTLGLRRVAGVDEVGRGPLAGPVTAAAVVLPPWVDPGCLQGVDDSKRLSAPARRRLLPRILEVAVAWAVGEASVEEIDRLHIRRATFLAMERAVRALPVRAEAVLVDGPNPPPLGLPEMRVEAVVGGDHLSLSIAAASVVAKVMRDMQMEEWDRLCPGYGWARNKGYGTASHRRAIARLGPSPLHRRSFLGEGEAGRAAS